MAKHITAASIVVTLIADLVYPTGRVIEGFAEDALRSLDDLVIAETIMGVDRKASHGYVAYPPVIRIQVMPDKSGFDVFENIAQIQQTTMAPIILTLTMVDVATNKKYTLTNGVLNQWKPAPDATRLLQANEAMMTFEACTVEEYGA